MSEKMPRRRRARRGASLSKFVRARAVGILYVSLAGLVVGAIGYLVSILPSTYIVISDTGVSVASSVGAGSTGFDLKVIAALLGGFGGIFLMVSGLRRLGVKL